MNRKKAFALLLLLSLQVMLLHVSCAPQKAVIERSAMNGIMWPGPPEHPRITYLWNLSSLSEKEDIYALLAGSGSDLTDPQSSPRLLRPYGIFVDNSDVLYIADTGAYRITIIDLKSNDVKHITGAGEKDFLSPISVAAFNGRIYVSDSLLGKVFMFDDGGKLAGEFEGEFTRPTMLSVDRAKGTLYVADTLANVVYRYSPEGKRLGSIGKGGGNEGEFNSPSHIWVDGAGRLYVTDSMNFRVQFFSPDGKWEGMFGNPGDSYANFERPKGIATDSEGNIYIVDSLNEKIKIFDRAGNLLLFFGESGQHFGQLSLPSGIFIDSKNNIFVADTYNGRIQVFQYIGNKKAGGPHNEKGK